jgi:hypothetical protein
VSAGAREDLAAYPLREAQPLGELGEGAPLVVREPPIGERVADGDLVARVHHLPLGLLHLGIGELERGAQRGEVGDLAVGERIVLQKHGEDAPPHVDEHLARLGAGDAVLEKEIGDVGGRDAGGVAQREEMLERVVGEVGARPVEDPVEQAAPRRGPREGEGRVAERRGAGMAAHSVPFRGLEWAAPRGARGRPC